MAVAPTSPALRLANDEFLFAMRRRLGLGLDGGAVSCEGCGRELDLHGHHRVACTRTGRIHARHRTLVAAWQQVLQEAGGVIPDRNVERMLRNTHIPVDATDSRRMDLVVPGLSVARGLPLFCDVTCVSPIGVSGHARPGCTMRNGNILLNAARNNSNDYPEVESSGLGRLLCLGVEPYGRWCEDVLSLVPDLARDKCRGLPASIRSSVQAATLRRWWGLLGIAVQRSCAACVLRAAGGDLANTPAERPPALAELPAA